MASSMVETPAVFVFVLPFALFLLVSLLLFVQRVLEGLIRGCQETTCEGPFIGTFIMFLILFLEIIAFPINLIIITFSFGVFILFNVFRIISLALIFCLSSPLFPVFLVILAFYLITAN